LQSWGTSAKFSRRTTQDFPSRSAVLGLLCAALGAGGEQKELLASFAPLPQTVVAYTRRDRKGRAVPPRVQLQDFHMVGSGYDDKDPWQTLHIPKTSVRNNDGSYKSAQGVIGNKLTYRFYLEDSAFAVALAIPDTLQKDIEEALVTPCWDISLGRKCCVPTEFVYQGVYASMCAALTHAEELAQKKQKAELFRVLDDAHAGEQIILADVPLRFGPNKLYAERLVTVVVS
jgi:CRISPR system Cascade subunit CasD